MNNMPTNINQLSPTGFLVTVDGYEDMQFFCQRATLPGITVGTSPVPNPSQAELTQPGDKLQFEDLVIGFIIDEDMNNFKSIEQWIRKNTIYRDTIYRDIRVDILTNKKNKNVAIKYHNAYPFMLSPVSMDYTLAPDAPVSTDVIFKYTDFEWE